MSRRTENLFWDLQALKAMLPTRVLAKEIIIFNRITSTNDFLKRIARRGAATGTLVIADEQTAGRGRLRRYWHSPPGKGLWFSFLMRPRIASDRLGLISLAIAAIISKALTQLCGPGFSVKWPNDVIFRGQKVCGILCETQISQHGVENIVAGVGLNVSQRAADFHPDWRDRSTSLLLATGREFDRRLVLHDLLENIDKQLFTSLERNLPALKSSWYAQCLDLGKQIIIAQTDQLAKKTAGIFAGIGDGGELILRLESNQLLSFQAGEVTLGGLA